MPNKISESGLVRRIEERPTEWAHVRDHHGRLKRDDKGFYLENFDGGNERYSISHDDIISLFYRTRNSVRNVMSFKVYLPN